MNLTAGDLRRVLMIAPHFPPDTGAATHRVRLLAPHLRDFGWDPTVLTIDRDAIEGRQDPDLERMVPPDLDIVRGSAWSAEKTRRFGVGDLGLRSLTGLFRAASQTMHGRKYDALFITIFPTYTALLGPLLKRRFKVPFVLDYIDPWVSAWGKDVGGGHNGSVDIKSRLTRLAALTLEPLAVRSADAITAVSSGTYEAIQKRISKLSDTPCAAIPYGGDKADYDYLRVRPRENRHFDAGDGNYHICYVGTLLPLGFETLRAVFRGLALLRESDPVSYNLVRLHFFGTSNQTSGSCEPRVLPVAAEFGIGQMVTEHPLRIDYLDALTVQVQASAILLMGSTESHYTASKLYPALLAGRPLLAVYHELSSVSEIMTRVTHTPEAVAITYSSAEPAETRAPAIADALAAMVATGASGPITWNAGELAKFSAHSLAGKLAGVFDLVAGTVDAT